MVKFLVVRFIDFYIERVCKGLIIPHADKGRLPTRTNSSATPTPFLLFTCNIVHHKQPNIVLNSSFKNVIYKHIRGFVVYYQHGQNDKIGLGGKIEFYTLDICIYMYIHTFTIKK